MVSVADVDYRGIRVAPQPPLRLYIRWLWVKNQLFCQAKSLELHMDIRDQNTEPALIPALIPFFAASLLPILLAMPIRRVFLSSLSSMVAKCCKVQLQRQNRPAKFRICSHWPKQSCTYQSSEAELAGNPGACWNWANRFEANGLLAKMFHSPLPIMTKNHFWSCVKVWKVERLKGPVCMAFVGKSEWKSGSIWMYNV